MHVPDLKDIEPTYDKNKPQRIDLGDGFYVVVMLPHDTDYGPPWEECDGHGTVSAWTQRDKQPGERILCSDRSSKRYYDYAGAIATARREGRGLGPDALAELTAQLGHTPTQGQLAVAAVERDYEMLRGWCNDEWHWIGVCVTIFNADDEELYDDSLWGVTSSGDYWQTLALDYIKTGIRKIETEAAERSYWECRDVQTVTT